MNINNHNTPTLETERLILRKFTENDIESLFSIYKDEEVNKYLPWFPMKSLKEAKIFYYEKYAKVYKLDRGYSYAICLKTNNLPIGYVKVSMDNNHDLGYGLRKEFWHKGIVTEAGKSVLTQVKQDGLSYVTATHDVKNSRSGEVMKKLGMNYKYSYEEQWQPKNILVTFRMYQLNLDGQDDRVYKEYWDKYEVHFTEKDL
jgi:RimJ/RimL family protein N-acetyltransferase